MCSKFSIFAPMKRILFLLVAAWLSLGAGKNPRLAYIEQYSALAVMEMQRTGVPASITLAQGMLESGAGTSPLATKAISASVDKDPSGLWGKVNDVYSSIEDKTKEETLVGQFDAEMENNKSNTTVDALSYETSAVAESLAEATIQEGKKLGFFKRLWAGVKGFVSGKVGMVMNNVGNIISALISVIVKLVQYILLAVSSIYLIILGLIGPFVFALSLMPGFQNNISVWIARYIQISFWCPIAALIDFVNFKLKDAMLTAFWSAPNLSQLGFPLHLIVMDLVTLICLLAVPQMASWIISGSGASDVNRGIATTAQKGAMFLGKFK